MKNGKKALFFELILLISSVPIFRTVWELLDRASIAFSSEAILFGSFAVGLIGCAVSFDYLIKK